MKDMNAKIDRTKQHMQHPVLAALSLGSKGLECLSVTSVLVRIESPSSIASKSSSSSSWCAIRSDETTFLLHNRNG